MESLDVAYDMGLAFPEGMLWYGIVVPAMPLRTCREDDASRQQHVD